MQNRQIECFVNLAETLNFSRTAELLYISQPTVTHAINTLEDELDLKLFIRTKRSVKITPAGQSLYKDMKDVLIRTNNAIIKAKSFGKVFESNLLIAYEGNFEVEHLSEILRVFTAKFPKVHVHLKIADFKSRRELFKEYDFDIIFTVKENINDISRIGYTEIYKGKFVCVLSNKHPLANQKTLDFQNLHGENLIFLDPLNCPSEMSRIQNQISIECPKAVIYYSEGALTSCTMIKGEMGIAVMPDFACPKDGSLATVPLNIKEEISYGIAWHEDHNLSKEIKGFITATKEVYKSTITI